MRLALCQKQRPERQEKSGFRLRQLRNPIASPLAPRILSSPQILPPEDIPPTPGTFWNMMTVEHP